MYVRFRLSLLHILVVLYLHTRAKHVCLEWFSLQVTVGPNVILPSGTMLMSAKAAELDEERKHDIAGRHTL